LFISYSGNTEETLSSLDEAIGKNLPLACFTSGGKMAEICREKNLSCAVLPSGIEPRSAIGYFFGSLLETLVNAKLIEVDIDKIIELAEKLKTRQTELEKVGEEIAHKLVGKTPVVYTTEKYKSLAMINKIKINENAKTPAFWNYFPELNHNEMVGFTLPQAKFHFLTFIDKSEHPQNVKRMKITADLYKEKEMETDFLEIKGENTFEKIFSTLLLGDWISYYLALEYNQDPNPVEMVENFKKLLMRKIN
jgi:glucose/mannose-6-phosphate isomerase